MSATDVVFLSDEDEVADEDSAKEIPPLLSKEEAVEVAYGPHVVANVERFIAELHERHPYSELTRIVASDIYDILVSPVKQEKVSSRARRPSRPKRQAAQPAAGN